MQEREISLIDLLVEVLLRWRVLVVWMLIGGILMGGFSYVRSYRAAEAQKAQMAEAEKKLQEKKEQLGEDELGEQGIKGTSAEKEYLQEQLTEIQESNVNTVLNYESFSEKKQAYYNSSVLMQIDALKIPQVELTFLISSNNGERSNSIERIYEDMISGGLFQWIADGSEDEVSTAVLSELITLSRSSRGLISGSDSFNVTVVHETEEQCKELAQAVITYLNQQHEQVEKELGAHDIVLVNEAYSLAVDTTLMDRQKNIRADIVAWNSNAAKMKETFAEEEWKYYNFLTMGKAQGMPEKYEKEEPDSEEGQQLSTVEVAVVMSPAVSIKYVVLGIILFAFLYIFYVFVIYILNNKLRAEDNVSRIYGIPQLGQIPQAYAKKKVFSFVDDWILRIRDRGKRKFSGEEATGLAAVAVKIAAKREELDTVYCIGCSMKEKAVEVSDKIQGILKEENIDMPVLNNILYNQEAMEQLQSAKGAFLLEKAGETLYDEIAKELELLRRQGIKVLGVVVVE